VAPFGLRTPMRLLPGCRQLRVVLTLGLKRHERETTASQAEGPRGRAFRGRVGVASLDTLDTGSFFMHRYPCPSGLTAVGV
jgi:hypothetical protein